jgi:predicted transposase YdaD
LRFGDDQGIDKGRIDGEAKGRIDGEAKGRIDGRIEGEAKALLKILAQRALVVTEAQQRQIVECSDVAVLDRWLDRALAVASVEELLG